MKNCGRLFPQYNRRLVSIRIQCTRVACKLYKVESNWGDTWQFVTEVGQVDWDSFNPGQVVGEFS